MRLAAAVIGLGRAGSTYDGGKLVAAPRSHVGAILQTGKIDLVAVSDAIVEQREHCLNDWHLKIPAYGSAAEMLQGRLYDVIAVAVPTEIQHEVLREILQRPPRLIFCEKPFCATYQQARDILDSAAALNVEIVVNYHRRWDQKIRALASQLRDRGTPTWFEVQYSKGLLNYGSHMLDLLTQFFGPIRTVNAALQIPHSLPDPSLSFALEFESGLRGFFRGIDGLSYELFDLSLFYPEARVDVIAGGYTVRRFELREGVFYPGYRHLVEVESGFTPSPVGGLLQGYEYIAQRLAGDDEIKIDSSGSAVNIHRLMEAIKSLAAKQGL